MDLDSLNEGNNGKVIYYDGENDIVNLPSRNLFYDNDEITSTINESIKKGDKLYFMPVNVWETDLYQKYTLKIYGVLMNGMKVEVKIDNIEVFFDILIPTNKTVQEIYQEINNFIIINDLDINHFRNEKIEAYPLYGFSVHKKSFIRIFSNTKNNRNKLIKFVSETLKYNTYSNDSAYYYRKASRENKLSLTSWVSIENYKIGTKNKNDLCEFIFIIKVKDYKPIFENDTIKSHPLFIKDRTLVMTWDIETYSDRKTGEVPNAGYDNDQAFMICLTIHWLYETEALYKICIVDKETESDSRWTTILCNNSFSNIIKAMMICWNHFKPDILSGFNDSYYDWPFIVEKMIKYNLLCWSWTKISAFSFDYQTSENIIKFNYNGNKFRTMKITADRNFDYKSLLIPGCLCIDVLPCYMKIYPRLEINKFGTLKYYLQDNNLPSKVDLTPNMLWKYYVSNDPKKLREIAYYCIVDAISVQRLLVKRSIISDYREISSLAYLSLSDTYYYAGGIRVCNLVAAYAWDANILINMKQRNETTTEKYKGAYVFYPDKGITPNFSKLQMLRNVPNEEKKQAIDNFISERPVICLDFASLYPSLIMTYNLSPEKILLYSSEYDFWSKKGYKLNEIKIKTTGSNEICAWSINHNNRKEDMGLFPSILQSLFAKRREMKKLLKTCSDKKEIYELIFSKKNNDNDYTTIVNHLIGYFNDNLLKDEIKSNPMKITMIHFQLDFIKNINIKTIEEDYLDLCFKHTCIDKKQNALKIYMNTFYGETGNHLSPFFLLELASGITALGRYNIELVADYVRTHGYFVKYGDTDSLYLTCPTHYFHDVDEKYINFEYEREEYFTHMVKISLDLMIKLENELNKYLESIYQNTFLKLEGEGCLFPCVFLGKKKYFGIQHINEVNFNPKKIFIKGVEIIKQGKSGIEKEIGTLIINQSVNIKNEKTILNIVEDILSDALNNTWNFEHFIQTGTWRPKKNNLSIQQFMKRMRIKHEIELHENKQLIELGKEPNELKYLPLEPGERFNYVLIKNNLLYDHKGRKINIKTGDMMEYAHIAKSENMSIDITYYLIHYVISTCARFISSESKFAPDTPDIEEKKNDEYSIKMAKSYLEKFIKNKNNISEEEISKQGKICKELFKNAVNMASVNALNNIQKKFLNLAFDNEENEQENINKLLDKIFMYAESYSKKLHSSSIKTYCEKLCIELKINPKNGSDLDNQNNCTILYNCINSYRSNIIGSLQYNLRIKISNNFSEILSLLDEYKVTIIYIIEKIKNNEDVFIDFDYSKINKFLEVWYEVVGFESYKFQTIKFNDFLIDLKCKRNNLELPLTKNEINNSLKNIDNYIEI